jgi:hypothetical protein
MIQGKRVPNHSTNIGDYWKTADGTWLGVCPTGQVTSLYNYSVIEHPNGTITVSPSIVVDIGLNNPKNWHGFLEHGVWRTTT